MSDRRFRHRSGEIRVSARRESAELVLERAAGGPVRYRLQRVGTAEFVLRDAADPGRLHTAYAIRDGQHYWVHLDGRTHYLESVVDRGSGAGAAGGLSSPMPGSVTEVLVAEGDRVEPGQVLMVLSAMKMQLEIKAPHAGVVRGLKLRPDDQVEGGVQLLSVEPDA